MAELMGRFSLGLGVLVIVVATLSALMSAWTGAGNMLKLSRWLAAAFAGLVTVSSACLFAALLGNQFNLEYVAHYSETALPAGYKLAAFWAGQEGSLLLWTWMLAGMSLVVAVQQWKRTGKEPAYTLATLCGVCAFFALLMIAAANPFKAIPFDQPIPTNGRGLNPMLQDPGMIAHPPALFLGYAGFTIPFAMMVGALMAGRKDNDWVIATRRWALASWLFLSIGILLGAQWAYVELGWGGYWAWDPVENASLLPWLTGTALLHSIMVQQHRGMLKMWNAVLFALTFILCIFGTYLTRSGVISSVHAFGKSLVGSFFLAFLVLSIVFSVLVIVRKRRLLETERPLEGMAGREGMFLATNIMLTGMMVITTIGTIFPLISNLISGQEITVKREFYDKVVAPMGLLVVAMMSVGPLLVYGHEAAAKLLRGLVVPAIAGIVLTAGLAAIGVHSLWALLAALICTVAVASMLADLVKSTVVRSRNTGENAGAAFVKLIDGNHRRYGGQVVHLGLVLIIAGIVGSSLFQERFDLAFSSQKQTAEAGGRKYSMAASGLTEVRRENYMAVIARLTVTEPNGTSYTVQPQRRHFEIDDQWSAEVAIHSTWKQDVYVMLAGWDKGGEEVAIQVIINPLVSWIWVGGIVLSAGAVLCMLPRLIPAAVGEGAEKATAPVPAAMPANGVAMRV